VNLEKILTSSFDFSAHEYELKARIMALNVMLLVIASLLSIMTVIRFTNGHLHQGTVNLIFSILSIFALLWMRGDKNRCAVVTRLTCLSGWIIISSLFYNIPADTLRIAWFLVLLPPTFFLCGSQFGVLISVLSLIVVIAVHTFGISEYSDYDILYYANLSFIITIFLVFYEYKMRKSRERLLLLNRELETRVMERTVDLQNEHERLLVTLRSIGDGIITTDIDGKIVLINTITEQLTGWSQQQATGLPIQKVFNITNEITGEPYENPANNVLNSGKVVTSTNHKILIARDGSQYFIKDSVAPIFDQENNIIGTVLVFRDVTEERKTETELAKVKKLESVGVLAGGIAHDFNNLLTGILGNIELVRLYTDSRDKTYPLLQEAKTASLRAKDLTQQLLTFSKGGDPIKETSSIGKIIIETTKFILRGSSVVCAYTIPEDLWKVDIDTGQISQVIQNITINASHAMPDGGMIEISCENITDREKEATSLPDQKYIKTSFTDTGYGITEDIIDKIFDPYFTTKEMGSGLGLAICHSIISKHGGDISVRSETGKGTSFIIYLPASLQPSPSITTPEQNIVKTVPKARILFMDDEPIVRVMTKHMLEQSNHEVVLAENGEEAIQLYKESLKNGPSIDLIIMDLNIPGGMGGKDAVQEILRINPEAKVVVESGYSNDPVMAHYQDYGFKTSIAKPFLREELNEIINTVLE
jgi:PAS domain S-box-containing protein